MKNIEEKNLFKNLIQHTKFIIKGSYDESKDLFELTKQSKEYPPEVTEFVENFCLMTVKLEVREITLENTIAKLKKSIKDQKDFAFLTTSFISMIAASVFFNAAFPVKNAFWVSRVLELALILIAGYLIKNRKIALADLGLSTINLKKTLKDTFIISVVLVAGITYAKWYLTNQGIIHIPGNFILWKYIDLEFFSYLLVAPLQELITRGVFQGALQKILGGKFSWVLAVLLSSLIFGILHLQHSLTLGLLSIVFSIIMGLLYVRHKNIIGISIIHFILGNYLYLLGVWSLITTK